ncbi:MAG: sigma-54 dependent transcriptional regulator [Pirellulaceae bacterium]|nr:sigma-54 dependent transcriptional regulator [Pirellulaceae bacterium]
MIILPALLEPIDLLLVDDEPDFLEPACRFFQRQGYRVVAAANAEQALAVHTSQHFHVAVIDQNMPGMDGIELLQRLHRDDPEIKIVVLTGNGSISSAVEAMKRGAIDYLTKPFGLSELDEVVRRVTKLNRLERENQHLRRRLEIEKPSKRKSDLIGQSAAMLDVKRLVARIASSDKPALILGESGTGKELVARAIHAGSPIADRPLVVINCAALPETLLESELFGYEKGAFTGANESKPGLFEIADGGTLFIDEFGELAGGLQAKLLRVLEDGSMRRIGSIRERKVKVRLVAATNRNLAVEVANGRFREDLFYRINVLSIQLPALRDRTDDIPLLVDYFLDSQWSLGQGVMELFMNSVWPGNVRQLINALERAKILSDDQTIHIENLPVDLRNASLRTDSLPLASDATGSDSTSPIIGSEIELSSLSKLHVMEVLRRHQGNKARSARALGIARRSLYRLLERFEAESSP